MALNPIETTETGGKPACNEDDGRWSTETIVGVYRSHVEGGRVALPLKERGHPLG